MSIRLIDAGTVPPLRSQTIYHGLAYAGAPDTVVLLTPGSPYVCIGFHQQLEREIDVDFCARNGIPIYRREVGGGAVYLDSNQLFVQWVMRPDALPLSVERRFELFARPLVETYDELGIRAAFRPVNDIHVAGRKIGGTGAARIGEAEVVVGNFLFDFDTETMARVLTAPTEKFRDKLHRSLREYMTSMKRELGTVPDPALVKAVYLRRCSEVLGQELVRGDLTRDEMQVIEKVDKRFESEEFLRRGEGLRRPGVKIHEDVWVSESCHKARGGLIRVTASMKRRRLEDVSLWGDFAGPLTGLEEALRDVELHPERIERAVGEYFDEHPMQTPGVGIGDWVAAIMRLEEVQDGT